MWYTEAIINQFLIFGDRWLGFFNLQLREFNLSLELLRDENCRE